MDCSINIFILFLLRFLFVSSKKSAANEQQKLTQSAIANLLTTTFRNAGVFGNDVKYDRVNTGKIRACIARELAGIF